MKFIEESIYYFILEIVTISHSSFLQHVILLPEIKKTI